MTRPSRPCYPERNRQAGPGTGTHPARQPGSAPCQAKKTQDQNSPGPGRQAEASHPRMIEASRLTSATERPEFKQVIVHANL